jgi:diacylglycerol kinase
MIDIECTTHKKMYLRQYQFLSVQTLFFISAILVLLLVSVVNGKNEEPVDAKAIRYSDKSKELKLCRL